MLIALISDTHIPEAGLDLPAEVLDLFAGCDQILHCGDLHCLTVVDRLDQLAPTLASRGNGDTVMPSGSRPGVPLDSRLADCHVVEVEGLRIGLTHDLESLENCSDDAAADAVHRRFGARVDIAVSGHTHVPAVRGLADGTVLVNPGSALMPHGYLGIVGTVGLLEIVDGGFQVKVIDVRTRAVQLKLNGPGPHPLTYGARPEGGR